VGKYDPLHDRLTGGQRPIQLEFAEIALLVGGLPPSAYRHTAWWSNNPIRHVQAQAWLDAGRRVTNVDLIGERVSFSLHAR
jgi:hypothetical protein